MYSQSQQAIHPIMIELDNQINDESSTMLTINDDDEITKQIASSSFVLSFTNLTYNVEVRRKFRFYPLKKSLTEKIVVLDDISGEAREGEILALMGASGSGKSTLIDALAGRIQKQSLTGTITLNGEALESKLRSAITTYVMQDDQLFPMLTVEETLAFAAEFRLPNSIINASKKKERVWSLIDQLGLNTAANTIIGDETRRGVSGGERRRVSIGVGIVHDPVLLFLDEPTSGLDSTSAFTVVNVLRKIALRGSVVVMSIHQPSYRIVELVDQVILLSKGKSAFRGSPARLSEFFSGFGRPVPEKINAVEFALDLISELEIISSVAGRDEGIHALVDFNRKWQTSSQEIAKESAPRLEEALQISISTGKLVSTNKLSEIKPFANSSWTEILALARRSTLNSRRTPELFATRMTTVLMSGLLLATIFWRMDKSRDGITERLGFFAFAICTAYFSSCQFLPVFIKERHIFTRETAYNSYRRSSYVFATSVAAIPPLLALALAFSAVTFWAAGLSGGPAGFGFYAATIAVSFWAGNSLASFVSGLVPNVLLGFTVMVAVSSYFLLLSGFFIVRDRIPEYWLWLHYASLVKYPYEAVMRNEFGGDRCFVRGAGLFDGTPFGGATEDAKASMLRSLKVTPSTCLMTGSDVLRQQGIELNKWMCLVVVVAWGLFYRFLFYVTLLLGSKNKRK